MSDRGQIRLEPGQRRELRDLASGDAMRAFSALGVFTWHAFVLALIAAGSYRSGAGHERWQVLDVTHELGSVVGIGARAALGLLWFFFVLSAYLISRPFLRELLQGQRSPHGGRYVVRRMLRIYPLFLTVLLVCLLADGVGSGATPAKVLSVVSLWDVFDQPDGGGWQYMGHAWSLGVEMLIYLLVPAGIVLLARLRLPFLRSADRRAAVVVLGAAVVMAISLAIGRHDAEPTSILRGAAAYFMPGLVIATAEIAGWLDRPARRLGDRGFRASLVVVVLLVVGAMPLGRLVGADHGGTLAALICTILAASLLLLTLVLRELSGRPLPRALTWEPARWLGRMAFPIYMAHVPIVLAVGPWIGDAVGGGPVERGLLIWIVSLGPVLVASYALHRLVELPTMKLGRRLRGPRSERRVGRGDQGLRVPAADLTG